MNNLFELLQLYHDNVPQESFMIRHVFSKQIVQKIYSNKEEALRILNDLNRPKPTIEWRVVDSSN